MIIAVVYRISILAFGFLKDVVFDPRPAPIVSKKKKSKIVMKCWRIFLRRCHMELHACLKCCVASPVHLVMEPSCGSTFGTLNRMSQ